MCAFGKCPAAVNSNTNALVKNAVLSLESNSKYEVVYVVVLRNTRVILIKSRVYIAHEQRYSACACRLQITVELNTRLQSYGSFWFAGLSFVTVPFGANQGRIYS